MLPKFPATTRANSGLRVLILPEWGKDAVDLMTATETDVTYEGGGTMAPVLLAFKHELAQVKLTVRTGEKAGGSVGHQTFRCGL